MKILYVGQLFEGGTCRMRRDVLMELGHEVVPVDTSHLTGQGSLLRRIVKRTTGWTPQARELNQRLLDLARDKVDLVWIDKGTHIQRSTVLAAKRLGGCPVVHYNPDDPFGSSRRGWRVFLQALPAYDLHFVPRAINVKEYEAAGAKRVVRYFFSYDANIHRPVDVTPEDRARLGGPVGFIGDFERERAEAIDFVAAAGIPVRVWGPGWEQFHPKSPLVRAEGRKLVNADYARALCAFDVNLGFLRKANRDLHTQRTFEIPATGSFMLAERTDEHQLLFTEGKEAEFFSSEAELLQKVQYYLAHPAERRAVASGGRERCLNSGYSNHDRLRWMLAQIQELTA
jgi:spore maturation protein CgeB